MLDLQEFLNREICCNCDHWKRRGAQSGECENSESEHFEDIRYLDHSCEHGFKNKW